MILQEEKVEIVEDEKDAKKLSKNEEVEEKENISQDENIIQDENIAKDETDVQNENDENTDNNETELAENIDAESSDTTSENKTEENAKNEKSEEKDNKIALKEPDNITFKQEKNTTKTNKKSVMVYFLIFIGVLFLILFLLVAGFTIYNLNNSKVIAKGVSIYGIDVSGKTKDEAINSLSATFDKLQSSDIKLISKDYETALNPSEINLKYDVNSAVNYAFSVGKTGKILKDDYATFSAMINGVEIKPTYSLDEKNLLASLDKLSKEIPNPVVESSYYIEDSTLIITKGSDGFVVDSAKTSIDINNKLQDFSYLTEPIELTLKNQSPKEINLDEIYKEVHKEAKDAYYTKNPFVVHPSENGVDFKISLDEAKEKLAKSDKECEIALKTVYPKVTTNMIGKEAFPDLLGEFSTHYVSNANRTTNLRLAANKINGTVLLPGETFSYNKVVGARTIAAGYKNAAIYQNGEVVDGLGGGICQISTTLFNAALFANLEIVELHNHQFVPSYVGAGRDATVVYGAKDFKFKNSRKNAIKLECSVSGGIAKFRIFGVKEDTEYDVKVNASITSQTDSYTKSVTYRTLYLDGKQVKKEKIYNCTYKRH